MGWTFYRTSNTNKQECMEIISRYKGSCRKTVMKGNSFYALMTTEQGEDWVLLLLTQRYKGDFGYKDIQCNPYEQGIPISILKDFRPSNESDAEWLKRNLEIAAEQKANVSYDFGDILRCKADCGISWSNKEIKPNEEFYIKIDVLNPYNKRKSKMFRVVEKSDAVAEARKFGSTLPDAEILERNGGKRYAYYDTFYRLSARTMRNVTVLGKETA